MLEDNGSPVFDPNTSPYQDEIEKLRRQLAAQQPQPPAFQLGRGLQAQPPQMPAYQPPNRFQFPGGIPGVQPGQGMSPNMQMGLLGAQMLGNRFQPQQVQRGSMAPTSMYGGLLGLAPLMMANRGR